MTTDVRYALGDRVMICGAKGTVTRRLPDYDAADYAVRLDFDNGTEYVEADVLEPLDEPRDMRTVYLWGSRA